MSTTLRLIDPSATFPLDLGRGIVLHCRYLPAREYLEFREWRREALSKDDAELVAFTLKTLGRIVVRSEGISELELLADLATADQLWEILAAAMSGQLPKGPDYQLSEAPRHGTAAPVANDAPPDA